MATRGGFSFQKKSRDSAQKQIPGCTTSMYRRQLLVSTGIPSLDRLLGGGIGVGTVLLLEEDRFGSYSNVMFRYFLAEGAASAHRLLVATASSEPNCQSLISDLPQPITYDPEPDHVTETDQSQVDDLNIAWRYKNHKPTGKEATTQAVGHYFDLSKTMDESMILQSNTVNLDYSDFKTENENVFNPYYKDLLEKIEKTVNEGFHTNAQTTDKNILRIGLHSLGSPYWNPFNKDEEEDFSLTRFLLGLRTIMRSAYAVCLVTVPSHVIHDDVMMNRVRLLSDSVVALESFAGSDREQNPVYKDYHGLFHVKKQARLNSHYLRVPDCTDLAFKLRRKKFTIERFHLPPDLSETVSRSQGEHKPREKSSAAMICTSSTPGGDGGKLLDF